jgi:hypothetical protein
MLSYRLIRIVPALIGALVLARAVQSICVWATERVYAAMGVNITP